MELTNVHSSYQFLNFHTLQNLSPVDNLVFSIKANPNLMGYLQIHGPYLITNTFIKKVIYMVLWLTPLKGILNFDLALYR